MFSFRSLIFYIKIKKISNEIGQVTVNYKNIFFIEKIYFFMSVEQKKKIFENFQEI